mgnify:CR=1 FL=1|tara:strand:- start:152 stop:1696 length:1545 start_codon:yes stop_codon:yes gene_type:complete
MRGGGADWSRHCGTVEKGGTVVPAVTKKSFTAEPLINESHNWEILQKQVKRAASTHPWEKKAKLVAHVPMMVQYKTKYEQRAQALYGETIFFAAEKTRAWTLQNEGHIARFVKGHGNFSGVLPKLVRYVLATPGTADALSWHGFETWLKAPTDGEGAGGKYPQGVLLARTGKSVVRVAVVCYMGPSTTESQRSKMQSSIEMECDPFLGQQSDSEEEEGGEDDAAQEANEATSSVELAPSDNDDEDEEDQEALLAHGRAVAHYESNANRERALKRKIEEAEEKVDLLETNIAAWKDDLAQMRADEHEQRKRMRAEEIDEMLRERTVARDGCTVDPGKEHRNVVAAFVRDMGTYADPDGKLTEHFKSSKRHEKTFTHNRGMQDLQGEGDGLGSARPTTAQVRHDYVGVSHGDDMGNCRVVIIMEAKDEPTYFNVGVAQMQLDRAYRSRNQVCDMEDTSYLSYYVAAYATAPPGNDQIDHANHGQFVYWSSMTVPEKKALFEPIRKSIIGVPDYSPI